MSTAADILSLPDANVAVGFSASEQRFNARLGAMVSAVSAKLDEIAGPVIQRTVTERHDGGHEFIWMRSRPLISITSVTEYCGATSTVLTAETPGVAGTYLAELHKDGVLRKGKLFRRQSFCDYVFTPGRANVVVVAEAGRFADLGLAVSSRFAEAARLTLKSMWRSELNGVAQVGEYDVPVASFPSVVVPKAALSLLADELQGAVIA